MPVRPRLLPPRLVYDYAEVKRTCYRRVVRRSIINRRRRVDHRGRRSVISVRPWIICGPVKEVGIKIRAVIVAVSAVIVTVSMVIVLIVPAVIISMVIVFIMSVSVTSHARSRNGYDESNNYQNWKY